MGLNKSVIGLSKSVMHIIIRFVIKFCVIRWFRNFKILLHSRDTAYDSFIENILYDSHLTHMICNIHIIWLQISILIQWNQNFWDTPTQIFQIEFSRKCVGGKFFLTSNSDSAWNSASTGMCLYGVHSDFTDDLHDRWKWVQKKYLSQSSYGCS